MTSFQQIKLGLVLGAALLCLGCGPRESTHLYAYDITPTNGMRDTINVLGTDVWCHSKNGYVYITRKVDSFGTWGTIWYGPAKLNGSWEVSTCPTP